MSLATRCPDCKTLCPTTALQLREQGGYITCGHCGCVFSGVDYLSPADEDSWSADTEQKDGVADAMPELQGKVAIYKQWLRKLGRRFTLPAWLLKWVEGEYKWPRFAKRWAMILSLLLLWQCIWWQRVNLTHLIPALDTPLNALSQTLGTQVSGLASSRLKILGSSLKSQDNQKLTLEVRITNIARSASRWPLLEVQLLNSKKGVVSARLLSVSEYAVVTEAPLDGRIEAGEAFDLIAYLDTTELNKEKLELPITGFKVSLVDKAH